jgi:hypothetical protein
VKIGIGLPTTIPGVTGQQVTEWARSAEAAWFCKRSASVHPERHDVAGMPSGKFVTGRSAALAALFARLRRKPVPVPVPEPLPDPELEDEPWEDLAAEEVLELREELRRELERLSTQSRAHPAERGASGFADIKASRTPRECNSPPG